MSAGILRGVLERTLAYLSQKRVGGGWLFEEQWVQLRLAEMLGSLQAARGLYLDAALASEAWGVARLMQVAPMRVLAAVPSRRAVQAVLTHPRVVALSRELYRSSVPKDQLQRVVGCASIAKFMCSDLAVRMSMVAMEILGEDDSDPAWGVEKCMRDAKLAQIFEGTNQINRLHVTRGLIQKRPRPAADEERAMPTSAPSRPKPPPLARSIARAVWNLAKVEVAEGTLLQTLLVAATQTATHRGPAFARDWTFAELLEWAADRYADRPFLEYGGERISFAELNRRANRVAHRLRAAGIAQGAGVALMLSNHPRFLDAFFAVQKLGGYVVPVNTALVGDGLAYILDHSQVRAVVCDHETAAKVQAVRGQSACLERIWVNAGEAPSEWAIPDGMHDFAELEQGAVADGDNLGQTPPETAPSLLLYTSGTTGLPKAVVNSYGSLRVKGLGLIANILYDRSDKLYTCLPLFHANALLLTIMTALWVGIPVVVRKRFSASQFWRDVAECGATQFNTVGGMIPILLKTPPSPWDGRHRVRRVISAACPRDAWVPFEQRFGLTLWEAYGAVDGAGVTFYNAGNGPVGSLGRPPPRMKWRLVDDRGQDVPAGQPGELWVHVGDGRESRVEYWRNQKASNEKVVDGWLHTGDLMQADEDRYLYFVGRNTDSMRRRGENVSAYEVEKVVDAHPDVLESAAFGVPSPLGEQDIMISVVPVAGRTVDAADLLRFLEERLPRYALPTYLDVVGELPKTATHRVIKSELKSRGVTARTVHLDEPPDELSAARSARCATRSS
jgi:crotonobetaine/carnitine-CoA ligase